MSKEEIDATTPPEPDLDTKLMLIIQHLDPSVLFKPNRAMDVAGYMVNKYEPWYRDEIDLYRAVRYYTVVQHMPPEDTEAWHTLYALCAVRLWRVGVALRRLQVPGVVSSNNKDDQLPVLRVPRDAIDRRWRGLPRAAKQAEIRYATKPAKQPSTPDRTENDVAQPPLPTPIFGPRGAAASLSVPPTVIQPALPTPPTQEQQPATVDKHANDGAPGDAPPRPTPPAPVVRSNLYNAINAASKPQENFYNPGPPLNVSLWKQDGIEYGFTPMPPAPPQQQPQQPPAQTPLPFVQRMRTRTGKVIRAMHTLHFSTDENPEGYRVEKVPGTNFVRIWAENRYKQPRVLDKTDVALLEMRGITAELTRDARYALILPGANPRLAE